MATTRTHRRGNRIAEAKIARLHRIRAAAPELLAALRNVASVAAKMASENGSTQAAFICSEARAAIAKAEGARPSPSPDDENDALRAQNDAHRHTMQEMGARFDRMAHRHENGTAPRAVSAFQLFQTPPALAEKLVYALGIAACGRVLEPSAGLGRILDALAPHHPSEVVAVEMATACAAELFRQDRPRVRFLQRDFLACTVAELGQFDAVAMNPPFHLRADIRHILHARQFLKPGGRLAAICFDTEHRRQALRPLALTWEELPPGTFAKEGTHVAAVLLTMEGTP